MFPDKNIMKSSAKVAALFLIGQEITSLATKGARQMWLDDDIYIDDEIIQKLKDGGYMIGKNEEGELRISWDHE